MSEPKADPEREHIVTFAPDGSFSMVGHPLWEWNEMDCSLYLNMVAEMTDDPGSPGRYRARLLDTGTGPMWTWEKLP